MSEPSQPQQSVPLPPLYQALEPLAAERHGDLKLRDVGYGFAAQANAVPLTAEEFPIAARTLPIVFGAEAPHMPMALTGLQPGHNHFVDAEGRWKADVYTPAYLRRYPCFLVRVAQQSDQVALCIDPKAPQISREEGFPLFTDGKPSEQLQRAVEFCRQVEQAMLRTRAMVEGLVALNLLKASNVQFQHGGKPVRIQGFHAVDREALRALPADKLAELRDKGWLDAVYAHLMSVGGLPGLAQGELPAAA